jgi:iron(III) transport system substrate-binding protein
MARIHSSIRRGLLALAIVGLGPLALFTASAQEDYEDIVAAAQAEGRLVVYSVSSRINLAAEGFTAKYGIPVEANRLSETEIIERAFQEARSGVHSVDILLIEDYPSVLELLINPGYLVNYVPPSAQAIPEQYQNPLVFAYVSRIIGYNTEVNDSDPIDSVWDLTTPEYSGRVMIRDLAVTGEHQNMFAELMRRSDELEAEYERRFGEPLVMTEANAGLEFMRRLVQNDLILMTSDTRISEAVGAKGQANPPVGFFYVFSHHRHAASKDLAVDASHDAQPFAGYYYGIYTQIAANAPHPNAAKLFANYLYTEEGFAPWGEDNAMGFYSMHPDLVSSPDDMPWEYWQERLWTYDSEFAAQNRGIVLDAWLRYVQQ